LGPQLTKYSVIRTDAASKVEGEKAAWDFYRTNKPSYSFNTVLPDLVLGPIANPLPGHYSTVSMLTAFFNGVDDSVLVFMNPPANLVDSRDTAIIHVAALLANDVNGERLWALAHPLNINEILKIWREAYPERADKLPKDLDFPPAPKQIIDTSRSTELLKRFAGRSWIDAKTTILDNVKGHEA
jgi:nucleoside-diphosphate-sugar epimerase